MITKEEIKTLTKKPFNDFENVPRVDIYILHKIVVDDTIEAVSSIIKNTEWPFSVTVMDTSMYPPLMALMYNKVIDESKEDYVCLFCSDASVQQYGWLTKLMNEFMYNDRLGAIGPLTPNGVNSEMVKIIPNSGMHIVSWEWASLPIVIHKKGIFNKVGGYDKKYFLYGHDPDYFRRLEESGYKVAINSDIIAEHKKGSTTKSIFTKEEIKIINEYNKENN